VPIDVSAPGSPGWWLNRLIVELGKRRGRYELLDTYYRGEAGVPALSSKATRQAYARLMALSRLNFAELVTEAVRERMRPVGFRTGAVPDGSGDAEAWRIWQANNLDADSDLVHTCQLSMSDGYVIVGGRDPEIDAPLITPEDPRQVIIEEDPRRRRRALAGLKVFKDTYLNVDRAYLYLPGFVVRASRRIDVGSSPDDPLNYDVDGFEWEQETPAAPNPGRLPSPVVPVVRFPNRPNLYGRTKGEFEPHLSVLDRINYQILNRLEIATLQAFRQRAVKGVPVKDEDGNDIDYDDVFAADPGALWLLPDTADLWESGQVDLGPLRLAIRDDVQDLAAVTRTPLFYLTPDAANGSAEGASLAREGLVFKTEDRIVRTSESWEQVMSLAFLFSGDETRARRPDLEALWAPAERFSLAERYDAASKAAGAGVPWRTTMTDVLQFSPQQVDRMEAERASDALLFPPPPPPAPPSSSSTPAPAPAPA
jgi:hypothetical protein